MSWPGTAPAYGKFVFGNLVTDTRLRLSDSIAYRRTLAEIEAGVAACRRECGYFDVCGGGRAPTGSPP